MLAGVDPVHAIPQAWATPQPALCPSPDVSLPSCEQHSPWVAAVDPDPDRGVQGVRVNIAFSISATSVIQRDNELGAGIVAYGPNNDGCCTTGGLPNPGS